MGKPQVVRAIRFCVDCEHCRHLPSSQREPDEVWNCMAARGEPDLVTGRQTTVIVDCRAARQPGANCGPDGRLFVPKQRPPNQGSSGKRS